MGKCCENTWLLQTAMRLQSALFLSVGANWLNQCIAMGNVHNWLLYNLFKLVKQTPLTRPSLEVFLLEEGNTVLRREK